MTIFKTWEIISGEYSYWFDELPDHDKYTLIVGQANVPEHIVQLHEGNLKDCYEHIMNEYELNTKDSWGFKL